MDQVRHYSTAEVAARDRFAYWREAVCDSYVKLGCNVPHARGFSGDLDLTRYSMLSISEVGGTAHQVARRSRDIRAATEAFFLVSLQTRNTSRITQFGKSSVLKPGDMGIYDSTHPYVLELGENFSQTVLQLPKERLLARLPAAQMMGGTRIDGQSGIGKLVRENILAFSSHMKECNPTVAALLQDTLIDLIATGLASGAGIKADLASPEQHVLLRARSFIAANISDPGLDRNRVAGEIKMSVRRLNDIFAKESSSISEEIRKQRLNTVAGQLRDPRFAAMTISEIALKCGYNNLQHFSTLFRSTFGVSPKAWRNGEGTPQA